MILKTDPTRYLGQVVTLEGTARDAALGAVVLLSDGTPVFVGGLLGWDPRWERTRVRVTGRLGLRKMAPDPEVNDKGEVSHGMFGDSLVVEEATWEAAP